MARQVLENGVILPAEYSDDWYDDMTSNLTKLDDVIGSDSEKLSSADVGAAALSNNYNDLDNLPTIPTVNDATLTIQKNGVNVQTFTANASSNVTCNITVPTKTSDLTNDSNFVDTSNSAVSSGITSAKVTDYDTHIADTDIHVTASDKTIWNAVTSKANDSDVVHKSGDETVGGVKTFTNDVTVNNSNATVQADVPNLIFQNPLMERASTTLDGEQTILFTDKNDNNIASIQAKTYTSGTADIILTSYSETSDQSVRTTGIVIRRTPTTSKFHGFSDNITSLGDINRRWSRVYAMNYYYGNDNVEFSTKFVTTDTNQTISGNKTFNGNTNCVGELSQTAPFKMTADTSFVIGNKNTSIYDQNGFQCANEQISYNNSKNIRRVWAVNNNGAGTIVSAGFNLILSASGTKIFYPITDSDTDNGTPSSYWKNTYTKFVNGLEPSSLSLPSDRSARIDISSYITNLDNGNDNQYIVPANGYIYLYFTSINGAICFSQTSGGLTNYAQTFVRYQGDGQLYVFFPVRKDDYFIIKIYTSSTAVVQSAYFIPCQGNV